MRDATSCRRPMDQVDQYGIQMQQDDGLDTSWIEQVCFCEDCWSGAPASSPSMEDGFDGGGDALMLKTPPGGQYGNGFIGVCRADPSLVSLLDFWRRMALYDRSPNDNTPYGRPDLGKKAWALSLVSLHDECLGYAFLAVASCYYAKVSGNYDMNVFHLKARVRSVSNARKQLQSMGLVEHMISNLGIVLAAELVAEDYKACSQHAKFLASVLQPKHGEPVRVGESTRHSFLHMDVDLAVAMGTLPFIDLSTWSYENGALDAWSAAILEDPAFHTHPLPDLDRTAIADADLSALLTETRYYDALLRRPSTATSLSRGTAFQLSTVMDIIAGKLQTYYHRRTEQLALTPYAAMTAPCYLHAAQQAAAALATLYYIRLRGRQEYAGPAHHDAEGPQMMERFCAQAPRLYRRIERTLRASERAFDVFLSGAQPVTGGPQQTNDNNDDITAAQCVPPEVRMRIWILHVCGAMEATADFDPPANLKRPSYCREALRELLRKLGLAGKAEVFRGVLEGFLPLMKADEPAGENDGGGGGCGGGDGGMRDAGKFDECRLPKDIYGPRWMSPVLRTWGLTNWDGEMA